MLRKLSRNNKRDFGKIISLLRILNGFPKDRKVSKIPRKPSSELMIRKSIYGPARLLNIPRLSETVVGLLETTQTPKPVDPTKVRIKELIEDLLKTRSDLINAYKYDDIRAEELVIAYLRGHGITASPNDVGEVIYPKVREKYGAEA